MDRNDSVPRVSTSRGDVIDVSAVVLRDAENRILTVRKRGTSRFMFPGGKPEPGESFEQAAVRECREELGVCLDESSLNRVGVFTAPAANEAERQVRAVVFAHRSVAVGEPSAEIAELRWLDATAELPADLAPLLADHVLPVLMGGRLRRVTCFTGSAAGADPVFAAGVAELGAEFARRGIGVVYGGGRLA